MHKNGTFIISLDFELYWGLRDAVSLDDCRANILGAREVIPKILQLFADFDIHATWSVVGFLFFSSRDELLKARPEILPAYEHADYSPYDYVKSIGRDESEDPCHFGLSLVKKIAANPGQEIGSHTFGHFYGLEAGADAVSFRADLRAAKAAGSRLGLGIKSLVFPRNQVNPDYLAICREEGITAVRGNENSWLYRGRPEAEQSYLIRLLRLADAYINLSGWHTYKIESAKTPVNVRSSRFLRPYSSKLKLFEGLKIKRITDAMTEAAKHGKIFHLWWHPHNFGVNQAENLAQLKEILEHYKKLEREYGMRSRSMGEIAELK